MESTDSHIELISALDWKAYSVSRAEKALLLEFVLNGLRARDCKVLFASDPKEAPFYIVFETPAGERHGLLVYAFFANSKVTKNRPSDEHRFQIKYGSNLKGILEVSVDPHFLITTLFLGIDLKRGFFVAADPLMNTPSPMSRSVEFKGAHVEEILDTSWAAWERDRRPAKTSTRPAAELEDLRTEVLVGGKQDRIVDLIALERLARGLDPGERHLLADKLKVRNHEASLISHELLTELNVSPETLFDLIEGASRLKMAVRGWVAEQHLFERLVTLRGVSDCNRIEEDGRPDISLRWKGSQQILIECKNTLRKTYSDGAAKVDFQKTRASKGDPCSRYYRVNDFQILAACLHAVTEKWDFQFALTCDLVPHPSCDGRISNNVRVTEPAFSECVEAVFDKYVETIA